MPVEDFITPGLPAGYDTVLGYLARKHPEALAFLDDPITETMSDGFKLRREMDQNGYAPVKVPAPAFVRRERPSIVAICAYPRHLLGKVLG